MQITILELTSLFLYVVFAVYAYYLAIMFFLKIKRARGSGIDLAPMFGLAFFVLFFGTGYIILGYYHFFKYDTGSAPEELYRAAILLTYIALIAMVFFSEKIIAKTKFVFTIFSIGCCIYGIFFTFTPEALRNFTYLTNPISVTIIMVSFLYFILVKTKGDIRKQMIVAFICYFGFIFFFLLDTDAGRGLIPLAPEITSIIATLGVTISMLGVGLIFLRFETFTEFGWREKLKELFIIAPNGVTLFHSSFITKEKSQDHDLISSGLTGVEGILGEMMESKQKLKVVDHQDVKIIFEYGEFTTMALITYENLRIYYPKLISLSTQFENLFQEVLAHWDGQTEVFRPANRLVEEIFG